jgi:vacuolar protein sorting-associated protein 13A/C
VGSSDLLGNPNKLRASLGSGIREFKQKPADGFEKGLLEGTLGAVKGVASVASHTVGAASGAVSSITGTLAKPLTALTFDEEY